VGAAPFSSKVIWLARDKQYLHFRKLTNSLGKLCYSPFIGIGWCQQRLERSDQRGPLLAGSGRHDQLVEIREKSLRIFYKSFFVFMRVPEIVIRAFYTLFTE